MERVNIQDNLAFNRCSILYSRLAESRYRQSIKMETRVEYGVQRRVSRSSCKKRKDIWTQIRKNLLLHELSLGELIAESEVEGILSVQAGIVLDRLITRFGHYLIGGIYGR